MKKHLSIILVFMLILSAFSGLILFRQVNALVSSSYSVFFEQSGLPNQQWAVWGVTFGGATEYSNSPGNTYSTIIFTENNGYSGSFKIIPPIWLRCFSIF